MQIIHKIDPHLSIAISFKFFLVDRIDPPENESTILSISKNLDSLINNKERGISIFEIGWCRFHGRHVWLNPAQNWARRNFRNFRWTVGVGGRAETKDIRLFGGGRRRPSLSTSATTGSIEFRWITIARECNGKRTLT